MGGKGCKCLDLRYLGASWVRWRQKMSEQLHFIVMAKLPIAGRVKTRLCPPLTLEQSCQVYAACLEYWLKRLMEISEDCHARLVWCFDPAEKAEEAQKLVEQWNLAGVVLQPQGPGNLGERVVSAWEPYQSGPVLFFGADSPDVPDAHLISAAEKVKQNNVVLGPTDDGGYWTLGVRAMSGLANLLRDIPWSSGQEFAATADRARQLGQTLAIIDTWQDVDKFDDLAQLVRRLDAGQSVEPQAVVLKERIKLASAGLIS